MNNWKYIWGKRKLDCSDSNISLKKLISIDGFDTGYGTINEQNWNRYIKHVSEKLNISDASSIYEVGCGAGAFLYNFSKKNHEVGGIDYSSSLVQICKKVINSQDISVGEALCIDTEKKYDFVVSNSVFFYFPDLDYAKSVIEKMIEKSNYGVAILEVNDIFYKNESLLLRKRHLTEEEYDKRYDGLEHLYYDREWFYAIAKKYGLKCTIENQVIKDYQNSSYRFNVYMKKNEK